ncbi:MAG: lysophospholipase [Planctomycetes bacterium]|nr:lysophospholipase [Planctomycetota bacterium]
MATTALREEELQLTSSDGTALFARRVLPEGESRGHLAWVHGVSEHSGRYLETMRWFAERGFGSTAIDLRGHGHSAGARVFVKRWAEYTSDVLAFMEGVEAPAGPSFLIGHSMGGLVVGRALQTQPQRLSGLRGAVITSPCFGLKVVVPAWKIGLGRVLSRIAPGVSLPSDLDANLLSHDSEQVRAYEEDPLVTHSVTARWYTEVVAQMTPSLEDASRLTLPLLFMHGAEDGITDPEATAAVFERVSSEDKEFELWPNLRHELLNEVEREAVRERLLGWFEARLG